MWDGVSVVTPPADVPIQIADLKARLPVDFGDDDTMLQSLLSAAVRRIDGPNGTGIAMMKQTWRLSLDCFPCRTLRLPGWPITAVTAIRYVDNDGVEQTIPGTDYRVDINSDPVRVEPAYQKSWPSSRNIIGAIEVEYELGADVAENVPADLITAVCLLVGHWYENREATSEASLSAVPFGVEYILAEYRRAHVAA